MHIPLLAPPVAAALAALLTPPGVPVSPPTVVEYVIPRPGNFPHDPAVAADGSVWYTDQRNSYIGHLDPATGKIVDYPTPTPGSGPHGLTVGPDGSVWYTGQGAGVIGRVDPRNGHITEFALPGNARNPHTPIYHHDRVWFTDANNNTYGSLDPKTG
jgi:virginiamycin B lyase